MTLQLAGSRVPGVLREFAVVLRGCRSPEMADEALVALLEFNEPAVDAHVVQILLVSYCTLARLARGPGRHCNLPSRKQSPL